MHNENVNFVKKLTFDKNIRGVNSNKMAWVNGGGGGRNFVRKLITDERQEGVSSNLI